MTIPAKLKATTENITDLYALLRPLGAKVGNCIISEDGLQFLVEVDKILLIQSWIPSDIFRDWKSLEFQFSMDIGLLLESLNVFSQEKSLEIEYIDLDFVLSCNTDDVFTSVSLKTYDEIHVGNLLSVFGDSDLLGKMIMKSKELNDVLGDLDASCTLITFGCSDCGLIISSVGSFGETEIKFTKESTVFDSFEIFGNRLVSASYNFSLFKHCVKALACSQKTCIRINYHGILSLQFMIPLLNGKFSFIEFAVITSRINFTDYSHDT